MTSETWIYGGTEAEKVAIGATVRQSVAAWGGGHVEALINNRGPRPVVDTAIACPFRSSEFTATESLQAALDRAGVPLRRE